MARIPSISISSGFHQNRLPREHCQQSLFFSQEGFGVNRVIRFVDIQKYVEDLFSLLFRLVDGNNYEIDVRGSGHVFPKVGRSHQESGFAWPLVQQACPSPRIL